MTGHEAGLVLNTDIGPEASYRSGAEEGTFGANTLAGGAGF